MKKFFKFLLYLILGIIAIAIIGFLGYNIYFRMINHNAKSKLAEAKAITIKGTEYPTLTDAFHLCPPS